MEEIRWKSKGKTVCHRT